MYGNWWETIIGKNILEKKYFHNGENFYTFLKRVTNPFPTEISSDLREAIINADFIPAGSILSGTGVKNRKISLSNCYVAPSPNDTLKSIFDTGRDMGIIFSRRGGCGINLSKLRPKGATVHNSAVTSTGAVSFAKYYDNMAGIIGFEGRRAAMLVALEVQHPDIYDFLTLKCNDTEIQTANLSVIFSDEFMKCVVADMPFELHFKVEDTGEEICKLIDAKELFHKFCEVQWEWSEPGAIFMDRVRSHNLLSGYPDEEYHIDCCNPCVRGDTLLLTNEGYKKIEDVAGKQTRVWNGYRWSDVIPKVTGYNQKMLTVEAKNGVKIDCTYYHKFVLSDGTRVEAKDLKVGDKLQAFDLPVINGNKELEHAYTHGFYSGDGSHSNHKPFIYLYGEKENLINRLTGSIRSWKQEHGNRTAVKLNESIPYSKNFVPDNSYSIKSRLQWLAGIIDSDGCYNGEGTLSISSINKDFLHNIRRMLNTLGCNCGVYILREAGLRKIPPHVNGGHGVYSCKDSYRLRIPQKYVSQLQALGLETYRVVLPKKVKAIRPSYITIRSISEAPMANVVYCATEPFNHTLVFNGMMTGNCSEYFGAAYNACCLGSINLYNCVDNPCTPDAKFNDATLKYLTILGVRTLDKVLDIGYDKQPLDAHRKAIDDWRAIGLGIMGLADMFAALGIKYGSEKSVKLAHLIFETMRNTALLESCMLAKSFGSFGKFNPDKVLASKYFDTVPDDIKDYIRKYGLRNGNLMSIAPSGSISTMVGVSNGAEPYYKLSYSRSTHTNVNEDTGVSFSVNAKAVQHYMNINKTDNPPEYAVSTYEVNYLNRILLQAEIQKFVDNAISSTVNLPQDTTVEDIEILYMGAWEHGLKGITIWRDGNKRTPILGTDNRAKKNTDLCERKLNTIAPESRSNTKILNGCTVKESTACVPKMYVTVNRKDGNVFEVFTNADSGCRANISTITRLISLALRSGIKLEEVLGELRAVSCLACQTLRKQGSNISLSCGNAIADAIELSLKDKVDTIEEEESVEPDIKKEPERLVCPDCGEKTLIPSGKCFYCPKCGYSACE